MKDHTAITEELTRASKALVGGQQETPLKVLIASRDIQALAMLETLLRPKSGITIATRLLKNGHCDPLHGLDSMPDLLVFPIGESWREELQALAERPVSQRPMILVVGPANEPAAMRLAMQAGARDFLVEPVLDEEITDALLRIKEEHARSLSQGLGQLTAVVDAKGGAGATLLACNVAHILAAEMCHKVSLLDLHIQFGSISHYLDLSPTHSLLETLEVVEELDRTALAGYMTKHDSGLHVLDASQDRMYLTEEVSSDRLELLLNLMLEDYEHVVVDLPRQLDHLTSVALERADHVMVVVQQDLGNLRELTRLLSVLGNELGIDERRITVVVNRYQKNAEVSLADIEKVLKDKPLVLIPNDFKHANHCLNMGTTLYSSARKAAITQAMIELSRQLDGRSPHEGKGFWGRLTAKLKGGH